MSVTKEERSRFFREKKLFFSEVERLRRERYATAFDYVKLIEKFVKLIHKSRLLTAKRRRETHSAIYIRLRKKHEPKSRLPEIHLEIICVKKDRNSLTCLRPELVALKICRELTRKRTYEYHHGLRGFEYPIFEYAISKLVEMVENYEKLKLSCDF